MIETVLHKDIEDFLMEPKATGVREVYFVIRAEDQDILVLSSGKNGIEYNKTEGYLRKDNGVGIFHCLFGQGILVMQRNDEMGEAKEFKVVTLSPGKQVIIPAGFAHCIINIARDFLVGVDNSLVDSKNKDSQSIRMKRGFTYYIIEKKGEIGFEINENYSVHPQITTD